MKEKQFIAVCMIAGLMLLGIGFLLGKQLGKVHNVFPPKYHTEDMPSVNGKPNCITVVFADSVEGRPTFYVEFPDSTGLDSMYPEEIANGLNTGVWNYNEMLELKERQ